MSIVRIVAQDGLDVPRFAEVSEPAPGEYQFLRWITGPSLEDYRKDDKVNALFLPILVRKTRDFLLLENSILVEQPPKRLERIQ